MRTRTAMSILACLFVVALAAGSMAEAGRGTISINPLAATFSIGSSSCECGILMSQSVDSTVTVNFQIPKGYKKNSPLTVVVDYHAFGNATSCDYVLLPDSANVYRPGENALSISAGSFQPADGNPIIPAQGQVVGEKTFQLSTLGSFTLESGASIFLKFERQGTSVDDTCADPLEINGISVQYITR